MLTQKIFFLLLSLKIALCGCGPEKRKSDFEIIRGAYQLKRIAELPAQVSESSGMAIARPGVSFWTHNDGGLPELYEVDTQGRLLRTLSLSRIRNRDWEGLTQDNQGYLYVGDFGNNSNARRDLKIYKLHPDRPTVIDSITFRYADQMAFPPEAKERNFDCEAFFWHADSLYLFSKNRGKKRVKLYILPAQPGNYVAPVREEITLSTMVTDASLNPAHSLLAVLTYGKVLLFTVKPNQPMLSNPYICLKVNRNQTEAITFTNHANLLLTNEQGKLFQVVKKKQ